MRKLLIRTLNQLNQDFYQQVSRDFSESRNFSWHGWQKALPFLPKKRSLAILELACGNGRLVDFLRKELSGNFTYLGIDNSTAVLKLAAEKFPQEKFQYVDIIADLLDKGDFLVNKKKFDVLFAFGLSHHLPTFELRKLWLESMAKKLTTDGVIILSNWQFAREKERFQKNTVTWKKIRENEKISFWEKLKLLFLLVCLSKNDYLLDWRKGEKAFRHFRYCHDLEEKEMRELAAAAHLQVKAQFFADGKSKELNQYFILTQTFKKPKKSL
jgi:SAM-dependent methyltransferase